MDEADVCAGLREGEGAGLADACEIDMSVYHALALACDGKG